jgi:hypothetical protein
LVLFVRTLQGTNETGVEIKREGARCLQKRERRYRPGSLGEAGVGKVGPADGPIAEIQADEIAAVPGVPAVDDLPTGLHGAHDGSDFHLFAGLPGAPGGHTSSVRADIVRVGLFLLVGLLMFAISELDHNYNGETLLVSTFETAIEKHVF